MVAGQNAAYDQFPCQYQIFYRGKARQSMWYDPVFQVRSPQAISECPDRKSGGDLPCTICSVIQMIQDGCRGSD